MLLLPVHPEGFAMEREGHWQASFPTVQHATYEALIFLESLRDGAHEPPMSTVSPRIDPTQIRIFLCAAFHVFCMYLIGAASSWDMWI